MQLKSVGLELNPNPVPGILQGIAIHPRRDVVPLFVRRAIDRDEARSLVDAHCFKHARTAEKLPLPAHGRANPANQMHRRQTPRTLPHKPGDHANDLQRKDPPDLFPYPHPRLKRSRVTTIVTPTR